MLLVGVGVGVGVAKTVGNAGRPSPPAASRQQSTSTITASAPELSVASMSPVSGATAVSGSTSIILRFSSKLALTSPTPTITPPSAGSWTISGETMSFAPASGFMPLSAVAVSIPGGVSGVRGSKGQRLPLAVTDHFRVRNGSIERLQQMLATLSYSPLSWTPSGSPIAPTDTGALISAMFTPPAGSYSWMSPGWPAQLKALWVEGSNNIFTRGLIMSFQADHNLPTTGRVGASLWDSLLGAVQSGTLNTGGYNYALANKAAPQSLTIFHDGVVVLKSPANTGISGSPTPDGTFPVYTRLRQQVMHGTNPNGQKYADLVQYIAYFHGNDAVHYMDRADYGIPQSLGCIELPLADAAKAWPYLAYGTLVSVIN